MYVNKQLMALCVIAMAVQGCASVDRRAIPVVDSGAPVSEQTVARQAYRPAGAAPAPAGQTVDSGVMVMVHRAIRHPCKRSRRQMPVSSVPSIVRPAQRRNGIRQQALSARRPWGRQCGRACTGATGVPSSGGLSADEQLDGPVLALLTTARQQQSGATSTVPPRVWSARNGSRRVSRRCSTGWPRFGSSRAMLCRLSSYRGAR